MKRSSSSKQWLRRHVNDPYVKRSKQEGYRSRSAYKLLEIDGRDRLLRPGMVVVDLGCAPGGWSQVAVAKAGPAGTVVGIDLLEMAPIGGATFVKGDFTTRKGLAAIGAALGARSADLVLSDMAPNMTGIPITDQARSMELAELALEFARLHLKSDGAFVVKVFQGAGHAEYIKALRETFAKVLVRKPESSRGESAEQYLLARGLKAARAP
jgi:23S rRNA (uridine2552-2'-O)-methyltransferase